MTPSARSALRARRVWRPSGRNPDASASRRPTNAADTAPTEPMSIAKPTVRHTCRRSNGRRLGSPVHWRSELAKNSCSVSTRKRPLVPALTARTRSVLKASHANGRKPSGEIPGSRPQARGRASPFRRPSYRRPVCLRGPVDERVRYPLIGPNVLSDRGRADGTNASRDWISSRRWARARCASLRYFSRVQPRRVQQPSHVSSASCEASTRR